MAQRIILVDAFTSVAFSGNPAAVCVLDAPSTETWMQNIAQEINCSETAFCVPVVDGRFELRWFTPKTEVPLCGHATLAAAHVLWEEGWLAPHEPVRFWTRRGELGATPLGRRVELDFPAHEVSEAEAPEGLLAALGVSPVWIGRSGSDYLLELADEAAVRACRPGFSALEAVDVRGVILTAAGEQEETDFVSRYFAPRLGINEDPVTGSAHCILGPFWEARLGKASLRARQLSARGGELEVERVRKRVKLRGSCVTTLRASLTEWPPRAKI